MLELASAMVKNLLQTWWTEIFSVGAEVHCTKIGYEQHPLLVLSAPSCCSWSRSVQKNSVYSKSRKAAQSLTDPTELSVELQLKKAASRVLGFGLARCVDKFIRPVVKVTWQSLNLLSLNLNPQQISSIAV